MKTMSKYTIFHFSYSGLLEVKQISKLPHGKGITPQKHKAEDWDTPIWVSQGGFTERHGYWFKIVLTGSKIEYEWRGKHGISI
jgi:hypothetical protein